MPARRAAARRLQRLAICLLLSGLLVGCYEEPVALTTLPPTQPPAPTGEIATASPEPTPTAVEGTLAPTAGATPSPDATPITPAGSPSADCANGWMTPAVGSAEYSEAVALLNGAMGTAGAWDVSEMRYFSGPDETAQPAVQARYWYLRAALVDDPLFGGRWLLRVRGDLDKGVAAVAPFDSDGYFSPDWTAFVGQGTPTTYLGLPGQWTGTPYDFVTGVGGTELPGLSALVVGCLGAT